MNPVLEALQYPFMQQALAIALLLAVTCALLSCYIVHKGWALMGDAISHAVLTCTLVTGWLEARSTLKSDTLLGITFATLFAAGFLLYQKSGTDQHLTHILFGNLLGMTPGQRWQVIAICAAVLAVLAVKWRDYLLYTFDEAQARLAGLNVPVLRTSLLVMLTLTAIGAMQAVGVILVVAMLIAPGVSAQLVTRRFHHTLIVAVILSVAATCGGVLLSYHLDASTGASIVLCQSAGFVLMLALRAVLRGR